MRRARDRERAREPETAARRPLRRILGHDRGETVRVQKSNVARIAIPLKNVVQRFAPALLIGAAFAIMLLGRFDNAAVVRVRIVVIDVVAPLFDAVSRPVSAVNDAADNVRQWFALRTEVVRLSEENARLLQWQATARRLEAENASLRGLLNVRPEPSVGFVSARVIADSGAPFVRTVLVNSGYRDGVRRGQSAMNSEALIGRVIEVGDRSARILLLTDLNSRVPVTNLSSGLRGVLAGDNTERPQLVFLPNQAQLAPGDRIVTSGHGGVLPQGLPIGVVASVDGVVRVQLLAGTDRLEYVRIVRYDLPRLAPAGQEQPVSD
ncbi:MAG: rod shape-determining protein MreC [Alphaproteobacteria bacterium]|nr:rod shape-determining protein MreC [Alphaproteobacteria bacterium]